MQMPETSKRRRCQSATSSASQVGRITQSLLPVALVRKEGGTHDMLCNVAVSTCRGVLPCVATCMRPLPRRFPRESCLLQRIRRTWGLRGRAGMCMSSSASSTREGGREKGTDGRTSPHHSRSTVRIACTSTSPASCRNGCCSGWKSMTEAWRLLRRAPAVARQLMCAVARSW